MFYTFVTKQAKLSPEILEESPGSTERRTS